MQKQLTQLKTLYTDYIRQCRQVSIDAPYGAGIFSTGKDPRNHPCHEAFYDALGQMVAQWSHQTENPEPLIRYMLEVPYFYANEDACWYLFAAQNHVKSLIPLLSRESKQSVGKWFSQLVPKQQRLPVQEEILNLLMK